MKYALLLVLALFLFGNAYSEENGSDWLKIPSRESLSLPRFTIGEDSYFEVVASKRDTAVFRDLQERPYRFLPPSDARFLTGRYFRCAEEKSAYLVRAVFSNGGTGSYQLIRLGDSLLVAHSSLGNSMQYNKSAIVACLEFQPEAIYVTVSVAG